MKKSNQTNGTLAAKKAVAYARVSTKEQEKEGFSIDAQKKLLAGYALANGLIIAKEFVDIETAKLSGRTNFSEMIRHIKKHPDIRAVLVEKTDRLYRNLKDWVTLDEFDIEIHLVKEGIVLSRDSRSSEKFMHGIKVLMAKNYIDNLSEEARKGMQEKAEQGFWPTIAPLGYRNTLGPDGKKIIEIEPVVGPVITNLFAWYANGTLSLREAAEKARSAGLVSRVTGGAVPVSKVHTILRNPIYTGEVHWKGRSYPGRHRPLITRELFERVQAVLDKRNATKLRRGPRDFPFSGLMNCGHCGCALVGEIHKGRYIYYHCTGYKGKCNEPYVREEVIAAKFSELMSRLHFAENVHQWIVAGLHQSHADERKEHDEAVARLQAEYDRLTQRLRAMYVDKLDGRIDNAMYDKMSAEWRKEQDRCLREMGWHQTAERSYMEEGVTLLTLAKDAQRLFENRPPADKRRLLNFVLSNSTWRDGELQATFRQPFNLIAETTGDGPDDDGGGGPNLPPRSGWWARQDSNLQPDRYERSTLPKRSNKLSVFPF
jgi:site-specific DNA recombinase